MADSNLPRAEVGILLYPGCQQAMVHGMTDPVSYTHLTLPTTPYV